MLCATDCPVFEVKAKIRVSIPSGVIRFDYITKKQPSNTWISWVNAQMLYFSLSREKVMVEPGTAIGVSVQFHQDGLKMAKLWAFKDFNIADIKLPF